jgi:hypothetical protein
MQLPIYDAIKNLPRLDAVPGYTQIRAQNSGGNGQTVSQHGANNERSNTHETPVNIGACHVPSQPVASCQMERVKGIKPEIRNSNRQDDARSWSRNESKKSMHTRSGLSRFFRFVYAQEIAADCRFQFRISG